MNEHAILFFQVKIKKICGKIWRLQNNLIIFAASKLYADGIGRETSGIFHAHTQRNFNPLWHRVEIRKRLQGFCIKFLTARSAIYFFVKTL
jgi:hypothetical protein